MAGASRKLVNFLERNGKDAEFAATAVRNLVFDNEKTSAALVKDGAVPALLRVLQKADRKDARKQALAALVNLSNEPASGGPEKICSHGGVQAFAEVDSQEQGLVIGMNAVIGISWLCGGCIQTDRNRCMRHLKCVSLFAVLTARLTAWIDQPVLHAGIDSNLPMLVCSTRNR